MFVNGVEFDRSTAQRSRDRLEQEVNKSSSVQKSCLSFDFVHNAEGGVNDLLVAAIQKAEEQQERISQFWEKFFLVRPYVPEVWFSMLIVKWIGSPEMLSAFRTVLGDQVDEHLQKYREQFAQGFENLILVPHSQGGPYANEEFYRMTAEEQRKTHIVAVATPAENVANNGAYITLTEDHIAEWLFPFALPANASNGDSCGMDTWLCHAFTGSYMHGTNSRADIVKNIVALLPQVPPDCLIQGFILTFNESGTKKVLLWRDEEPHALVLEKEADASGFYCIPIETRLSDGRYWIEGYQGIEFLGGRSFFIPLLWGTPPIGVSFPVLTPI